MKTSGVHRKPGSTGIWSNRSSPRRWTGCSVKLNRRPGNHWNYWQWNSAGSRSRAVGSVAMRLASLTLPGDRLPDGRGNEISDRATADQKGDETRDKTAHEEPVPGSPVFCRQGACHRVALQQFDVLDVGFPVDVEGVSDDRH